MDSPEQITLIYYKLPPGYCRLSIKALSITQKLKEGFQTDQVATHTALLAAIRNRECVGKHHTDTIACAFTCTRITLMMASLHTLAVL